MSGSVIVLVIWANCAVLAIVIGVQRGTILALPIQDIVNLLIWASFTLQIPEIPILGMFALNANLIVPEFVLSFIAHASFQGIVINSIIGTIITGFILEELALLAQ